MLSSQKLRHSWSSSGQRTGTTKRCSDCCCSFVYLVMRNTGFTCCFVQFKDFKISSRFALAFLLMVLAKWIILLIKVKFWTLHWRFGHFARLWNIVELKTSSSVRIWWKSIGTIETSFDCLSANIDEGISGRTLELKHALFAFCSIPKEYCTQWMKLLSHHPTTWNLPLFHITLRSVQVVLCSPIKSKVRFLGLLFAEI